MYKVLLVDDEMPALRYLQTIITKYFEDFSIEASLTNGQEALDYLEKNPGIDVLITDIRMPLIDGIALSKKVRAILPDLHIVIVSGYSDFDYAQEAISASVDSYMLKPINADQVVAVLQKIHQKLANKKSKQEKALLPMIASGYALDSSLLEWVFGGIPFNFALIRTGNLPIPPITEPKAIIVLPAVRPWYALLQGRDDNEQIIIAKAQADAGRFAVQVEHYLNDLLDGSPTGTAIYDPHPNAIASLATFISNSTNALLHTVVTGQKKVLSVFSMPQKESKATKIDANSIRDLHYLMSNSQHKQIREFLSTLADQWEKHMIPQLDVSRMVMQILECAIEHNPLLYDKQESITAEINDLYQYAQSYTELLSNVYSILFDESFTSKKITCTEDLYDCTISYIQENYAKPITIQSLCSSIGISQTYLSRLFRKHGNTTFNTFLTKCRIENAIRFIKEHPNTLLRDVAESVGYEDPSYFSRVFRKTTGLTPSEYEAVAMQPDDKS